MREPPRSKINTLAQVSLNLAILIFDGRTYQHHPPSVSFGFKIYAKDAMNRGGGTTACACSIVYSTSCIAADSAGYHAPGINAKGAMKSARSFIRITLSAAPEEIGDARRRFGNIHFLGTCYCHDTRRYSPGLRAHGSVVQVSFALKAWHSQPLLGGIATSLIANLGPSMWQLYCCYD